MYAKLFSRITESSLMEEDISVRYVFMMLLAICDPSGHVIGTDVAIARRMNLPLPDFTAAVRALNSPDADSNSKEEEGRRLVQSQGERGYRVVNYLTYRDMKDEEDRRNYMRDYMQKYRAQQRKTQPVNNCKQKLTQEEAEVQVKEEVPEKKSPTQDPPKASQKPSGGVIEGKNSDRVPSSPQSLRFAAIMRRRPATPWSAEEIADYKKLGTVPEEDLVLLEKHYAANAGKEGAFCRTSMRTFLRHFQGEVDKARAFALAIAKPSQPSEKEKWEQRTGLKAEFQNLKILTS